MDYSRKISERLWNLPDKGELESRREETFIDDIVQKSHIQRELLRNLDDVKTAFDGGAGCGRFSILLAKHGIHVTHFDISQPMLDKARELAHQAGVEDRITFVKGALEDLSAYQDGEFDLSMSFDAPISYTYPHQEKVIAQLMRIASKRLVISVSSRLGYLPYLANPLQKHQFVLHDDDKDGWVQWLMKNRQSAIDTFHFDEQAALDMLQNGLSGSDEAITEYERGGAPWCITYTFMPEELRAILARNGGQSIRMAGPGAYARTIPRELLLKMMHDPNQREDFLDFCYQYDSQPSVCGMGKDNLLAVCDIAK